MLRSDRATDNPRGRLRLGEAYEFRKNSRSASPSPCLSAERSALVLQHILPEKFTTGGPRDMIGAVVGLLTLLSALVLGLLIWTAYGVYAGQNMAVQTIAAKVLQLDQALADYGPDATPLRTQVRKTLARQSTTFGERMRATPLSSPRTSLRRSKPCATAKGPSRTSSRRPTPKSRRSPPRTAIVAAIGQARFQMSFALSNPVSYPFLLTVVGMGDGSCSAAMA